MEFAKVLTKKTAIAISAVSVIAIVLVAAGMHVSASASNDSLNGFWPQEAKWAIEKARLATSRAMSVILEQAEQGKNVTLAKGVLKASIKICEAAESSFNETGYRRAFYTAILSALVARDSARVAVDGPETVYAIVDEVGQKVYEVEAFLEELEGAGVDVSLPLMVLEWAKTVHAKAQQLLGDEKTIQAVVTAEKSRMLARMAGEMALIAKGIPETT